MLTVLCVKYGNKYGTEYVERLRNMVSRNLTLDYEFACLTDDQHPIKGVKTIYRPGAGYSKLWWQKVHMFDPTLEIHNRILYFDLDVVIHANIDKLIASAENKFFGIRDFNRHFNPKWRQLNSSVMSWLGTQEHDIFEKFQINKNNALSLHGDQDWIWKVAQDRIQFWPDEFIRSYKWEIRSRNEINFSSTKRVFSSVRSPNIPPECCVAVFHGDPKPEDVLDPLVVDHWR
jgi:hypothetical protein